MSFHCLSVSVVRGSKVPSSLHTYPIVALWHGPSGCRNLLTHETLCATFGPWIF